MKYAYRGFVDRDGDIIAWPTIFATHSEYLISPAGHLAEGYRARWRQCEPDGKVDFDREPTPSQEDRDKVIDFLDRV